MIRIRSQSIWFDSFETFYLQYNIKSTETGSSLVTEYSRSITVMTLSGFSNNKLKQDIISMQPLKCYILVLFLENLF